MKTLANQTLIYDEDCPLCRAYTAGFVKAGMLDDNGKMPYSQLKECSFIDRDRAANEIALVDTINHKTLYGIDSLLTVIGANFPIVEKLGRFAPVNYPLRKGYRFISYNRKVIMPNPANLEKRAQCLPEFNVKYRIAYLVFTVVATAFSLHAYSFLLPKFAQNGLGTEFALAAAQMLFQSLFILKFGWKKILDYAGNLMTVSLFGSLLLFPMLVASKFPTVHEFVSTTYFLLVATIMFIEHFRRVELLQLPKFLCATWILYRILFLVFLLLNFKS